MAKKKRSVKVYGMSGYKSELTPTIMLKGKWLSDFGFDVGNYISITCEEYVQNRNGVDYISASMVLSAVDSKLRMEMGAEKMLSGILEQLRESYRFPCFQTGREQHEGCILCSCRV